MIRHSVPDLLEEIAQLREWAGAERKLADDLADVLDRCRSSFRSAADTDIANEVQRVMARYREARGR